MGILANENAIGGGNYLIERSLRFQSASSQSLSRTPASASNRKTWTWSGWVKRGTINSSGSVAYPLFAVPTGTTDATWFEFRFVSDTLYIGGYSTNWRITTQVFRDPSAWYHIVLAVDTTQATANDRLKLYVNGTQVTAFATTNNPTQNADLGINQASATYIGFSNTQYFDGYMTEINFIDGQALTPSSFGETDALTGVWVAKRYTGTYGTNGFYLPFNDGTSTTTLGQDRSGNANNWTLTNFTRSAGINDCWMYDVPSGNGSPSATQPSSNYATLNPLAGVSATLSRANLYMTGGSTWGRAPSTILLPSTGKFYFEGTLIGNPKGTILNDTYAVIGLIAPSAIASWVPISGGNSFWVGDSGHYINYSTSSSGSFTGNTSGTVLALAVDRDTNQVTIYQNNVSKATVTLGIAAGSDLYAFLSNYDGTFGAMNINFGQRSFAYTPPTGFKALCTANLPAPTIGASPTTQANKYFDATLYTGTGANQTITNSGSMSPDLIAIKSRSGAYPMVWMNVIAGANQFLRSDSTAAEATFTTGLTSFNSNGFSLGADTTSGAWNLNATTYVAWQWDAGSSTVTNTSGTISSQVRANTTAGFSIVTYTGTGANATVGHGLGVAPKMVIWKARTGSTMGSGFSDWCVYHTNNGAAGAQFLNLTNAYTAGAAYFNSTEPTSTNLSVGTSTYTNGSAYTYVAYCFAEIAGFSKFGSYTGNNSADGPFVYTGFRPKFVLLKDSANAGLWTIYDSSRSPFNVSKEYLQPQSSAVENSSADQIDFLSNGFKLRANNANSGQNNLTTSVIIYAAFAENPFNYSNAR